MKTTLTTEQLEKRKRTNKKILLYFLLPIFLIFGSLLIFGNPEPESKSTAEGTHSTAAIIMAKKYIENSATFPEEVDIDFLPTLQEYNGNETYRIVGGVNGKNAFGVKLRNSYDITLKFKGGDDLQQQNWELINLAFNEK